jgi:hypothetical protein
MRLIELTYTNYKGETRKRSVFPQGLFYGVSKYHDGPQWLLKVVDQETGEERDFALKDCNFTKNDMGQNNDETNHMPSPEMRRMAQELTTYMTRYGYDSIGGILLRSSFLRDNPVVREPKTPQKPALSQEEVVEKACRALCVQKGVNPDQQVQLSSQDDGLRFIYDIVPQWTMLKDEVSRFYTLQETLNKVIG